MREGAGALNVVFHRIESELGDWRYAEWRPPPDHRLAWIIKRVWDFEGQVRQRRERIFPDGTLEIIIQLDDRYRDVHGSALLVTPPLCVTGIQIGPLVIEAPPGPCRVLGIRFHALGAWAVIEHPLSDLTGATTDLHDLMGRTTARLADRCAEAASPLARIECAVSWVGERLNRSTTAARLNPAVVLIAGKIEQTGGTAQIGSLREQVGLTKNRLVTEFLQQVGLAPKRLARIHRFQRALQLLLKDGAILTDVALRAGYYDQPHMNAEFREFSGLTPRQLLNSRRYPLSTSVADET